MSVLNQESRFRFITNEGTHYFKDAPIGWDAIEEDYRRSKKSDSIFLNIIQNVQFIKAERQFLIDQKNNKGVNATIQFIKEDKIFNEWILSSSGFVDLETIEVRKMTATVSYIDNSFDKTLRANSRNKFEVNRITDINENTIPGLVTDTMLFKHREIFLRSELDVKPPYEDSFAIGALVPYISLPLTKIISSDDIVVSTFPHTNQTYSVNFAPGDPTLTFPESQQFFYLNNDRYKTLKIGLDIKINFSFASGVSGSENQFLHIMIQKSFLEETTGDFTPVQLYTLAVLNGDGQTGGDPQLLEYSTGDFPVPFDLDKGECLSLVYAVPQNVMDQLKTIDPIINTLIITEDSFFVPEDPNERFVDCITLYDAFSRVIEILNPEVTFKSDHIQEKWAGMVLFSGETARHILYNDEKAVLATLSFDLLYKFLFTLNPVGFGIRMKGNDIVLEVEEIEYFFDDEVVIEFGSLSDIVSKVNVDKLFGKVVIGYLSSGENEEVFGLQATNTVNEFGLPDEESENAYEATCEFRTDPNELELCYRKQYSLFPDRDTRYDKDTFAVDCKLVDGIYIPREWQEDFDAVEGIFSPDTAYNYRLTPLNCFLRHGKNFMMEYIKPAYVAESALYLSTKGNVSLKTQITGGILRQENDNVLLSDLEIPIFTSDIIEGSGRITQKIKDDLKGGVEKQNYLKTVSFINYDGNKEYAFIYSVRIEDEIQTELVLKYGY